MQTPLYPHALDALLDALQRTIERRVALEARIAQYTILKRPSGQTLGLLSELRSQRDALRCAQAGLEAEIRTRS